MAANVPFKKVKLETLTIPGEELQFQDPQANTAEDLRRFLQNRGLKVGGLQKKQLVALAQKANDENFPVISSPNVAAALSKAANALRTTDLNAALPNADIFPTTGWKKFPSRQIPKAFGIASIYSYLQDAVVVDSDDEGITTLGTDKSISRGRKYFVSGFVQGLVDCSSASGHFCLRSKVHASMRQEAYTVLVMVHAISGEVYDAACHCKGSALHRCSHVAALLFALEDFTSHFENDPQQIACTSQLCAWNTGSSKKESQPVYAKKYSNKREPDRAVLFSPSPTTQTAEMNVPKLLSACLTPGAFPTITKWQHLLEHEYTDYCLTEERRDALSTQIIQLLDSLKFGYDAPGEVPETSNQAQSSRWFSLRQILITASVIPKFINVQPHKRYEIIREHMWYPLSFSSKYTQYGKQVENEARKVYALQTGNEVHSCGMWVNPLYPGLAASPDGIVRCRNTNTVGVLEIKCPYRLRSTHPTDFNVLRDVLHTEGGHMTLRRNHAYYKQTLMQMAVVGAEWCDFTIYSPRGIWIERIVFDAAEWNKLATELLRFHHSFIAPEYFEMRTVRKLQPIEIV